MMKVVNLIRSRSLHHALLEEIEANYSDIPYFSHVGCLNRGAVLQRFVDPLRIAGCQSFGHLVIER